MKIERHILRLHLWDDSSQFSVTCNNPFKTHVERLITCSSNNSCRFEDGEGASYDLFSWSERWSPKVELVHQTDFFTDWKKAPLADIIFSFDPTGHGRAVLLKTHNFPSTALPLITTIMSQLKTSLKNCWRSENLEVGPIQISPLKCLSEDKINKLNNLNHCSPFKVEETWGSLKTCQKLYKISRRNKIMEMTEFRIDCSLHGFQEIRRRLSWCQNFSWNFSSLS